MPSYQRDISMRPSKKLIPLREINPQLPRFDRRFDRFPWVYARDRRTRGARFLRDVRKALLAHIGPNPSFPAIMLAERAAQLMLRLSALDLRWADSGDAMPEPIAGQYLQWDRALRLTLAQLGLAPANSELTAEEALDALHGRRRAL